MQQEQHDPTLYDPTPYNPTLAAAEWEMVQPLIERVRPYTLLGDGRLESLAKICAYINAQGIEGDFVECGTYKGGSAAILSRYLGESRHLWLYDSFEGMPETTERDGEDAKQYIGDCVASPEDVLAAMATIETPLEKITIKKGWFDQTFSSETAQKVALLHCDADWYDSVTLVLEKFYPLIPEGGVVVLDDFAYWEGCREAFYDFCQKHHEKPLIERIGVTQAFWIKGKNHNRILSVDSYQTETETKHLFKQFTQGLEQLREQVQQLQQNNDQIQTKLKKARSNLQQTQTQLRSAQSTIAAMETSKFWQLRLLWLQFKTRFLRSFDSAKESSLDNSSSQDASSHNHPSRNSEANLSDPETAQMLLEKGNLLLSEGRINESIQCYQKTISLNPDCWEAYAQLSTAFQQINQIDDAILCQQKLTVLVPEWAEAHYGLGNLLRQQSRLDEALESYDRAIALRPDWAEAYYAKTCIIKSATDHNSRESIEAFYSNPYVWETYINEPEVLRFYSDFVELSFEKEIEFDRKHIADVGCGTGHLLLTISQRFNPASLTGFEYSNAAIEVAKTIVPQAQFYWFNIYEPSDHTFDVIICTEVLEHLLYPDRALKNLLLMLNQAGVAVITVPNGRIDNFAGHINFWSPESWDVFLKSQALDFEVETGLDRHNHLFAVVRRK